MMTFNVESLGPAPHLGYTNGALVRAAERRTDAAFLAASAADPRSNAYLIAGEQIVLRKEADGLDPLFAVPEARAIAPVAEPVFLGLEAGAARFGWPVPAAAAEGLQTRADLRLTDLRSIAVQGLVDASHQQPLAEAKALLQWHARHGFCSHCGAKTLATCAGWKRECPACRTEHFPRTDPVAIMLAIDGERCLLGRQSRFAPGMWSCLAGFVEPGETLEEAARREIAEEAGVVCGRVTYFGSQPWAFPMSLMLGCHAQAETTAITVDRNELEDARWFARDEVARMLLRTHPDGLSTPPPMAIAHHIIRAWAEAPARD